MRASSPPLQSRSPSSSLDPPSSMAPDQIPVLDLRVISPTEIQTLFLSSSNSHDPLRLSDDSSAAAPKIDRSVFNESAGSRKQTYSRLRLAPHSSNKRLDVSNPNDPSSSSNQIDSSSREHQQIVSNLRLLFARDDSSFVLPVPPPVTVSPPPQTLTLDAPPVCKDKEEESSRTLVVFQNNDRDKEVEVVNAKGVTVDLAELAAKEDPYGEELRKRTAGLKSEAQLLGFLGGLEGEWMSRRQKRRFVDASGFGDHLPKGWKLLLGLKRKEGVPWVNCRRYVSPNGHHFETCKEVSSYIQSLLGISTAVTTVSINTNTISFGEDKNSTLSLAAASHPTGNDKSPQECTKCNLSFDDKGEYLQHQLSFHQKSRKRRRDSKPIEDGALVKNGQYICQFCNKTFDEKTRYVGHMEAHVRYQGLDNDKNTFDIASVASEVPPIAETLNSGTNLKVEADSLAENPKNEQHVRIEESIHAFEAHPSVETLNSGTNPKVEADSLAENPKNEQHVQIEGSIHAIEAHPSVENSTNGTVVSIQTPPSIENPITDKIDGIQAPPSTKDTKIDSTMATQSPSLIEIPKHGKAPAIHLPLIEEPKSNKSFSIPAPTSIKNAGNVQTSIVEALIENPEKVNTSEASEMQFIQSIENPTNSTKSETAAIQASSSIEDHKTDNEPITMLLDKDGRVEMSENKPLEDTNKGNCLTSSKVEGLISGPLDNSSIASVALSGQGYQDENAKDGKTPFGVDDGDSSQCCLPDTHNKDSEVENNMENKHSTNIFPVNHEVVNSETKKVESNEVMNHVEVETKNGIFDSAFANESTCSMEASQQACPDIETFDLNNYGIVDDGSKTDEYISATHRMLFENDTGAVSDETSYMECDSVGDQKEVELAERGVTFSELLANASAHANATLAETNQPCQESESLNLNNNTSDRIDNNEIEYEANKLAPSNTAPSHSILTTTPTLDYNSDLFASCFSANMNEQNGVSGFDINTRDSMLEEWEKQDSGLETRFENNPSGCEDIVSGATSHNFMEMMTMQENLEGYTSLVQSASTIPLANMMQDKLNNVGYQYQGQNNGALPNFSGMRLAPPEPSGYMAMPSANSPLHFPMPQQTMMFGYTPPQMVSGMGLQLGWGLTAPTKMMMPPAPCQFTAVCVWCSREFRHDGSMAEQPQSDTLGFICPSCKDRYAVHGRLGL